MEKSNRAKLPTKSGDFYIKVYKKDAKEHVLLESKKKSTTTPLVRIHSECITGDAFNSLKCDCGEQLNYALELISKKGGYLIYLRQEGRDIGLLNKINAYTLQDSGYNTITANHQLGFSDDLRTYEVASYILKDIGINSIILLSNNPKKRELEGINVERLEQIKITPNDKNREYLKIKKEQMGHLL